MRRKTVKEIFKNIAWQNRGFQVGDSTIRELRFADDVVLLSDNEKD